MVVMAEILAMISDSLTFLSLTPESKQFVSLAG